MLQHILVPLDGSPLAECVLPHIVTIAQTFDAHVTLLHVLEGGEEIGEARVDPFGWQLRKAEARAYMEEQGGRLRAIYPNVETMLAEGSAAERIIEQANERDVDLIILSSHGRSGLSGWNVSSVVQKVILRAYTSILIVPAYASSGSSLDAYNYKRILAPLDGSMRAENILPVLNTISQEHGSDVTLAHVVVRPEIPRRAPLTPEETELAERLVSCNQEEAALYLEQLAARLGQNAHSQISVDDSAISTLHDLVEEDGYDLVVLSAHGYSSGSRRPYGSVVTSFIAYSSAPLLIIQDLPPHKQEDSRAEVARQHTGKGGRSRMTVPERPTL